MLWMGGSGWGELLLVAGGLKPLACQWGIQDLPEHDDWRVNPFASKFSTIDDFEKHITELGVIFHTVDESRAADSAHIYEKTYVISKDKEKIDEFLGRFDGTFSSPVEGLLSTGRMLGYPEDANIANVGHTMDPDRGPNGSVSYPLLRFTEVQVSKAIMKLRGINIPPWAYYIWHRPANGNLLGDFSESSMILAKEYSAFFEEFHPEYHEWYLSYSDRQEQHIFGDVKCIVDWWVESRDS